MKLANKLSAALAGAALLLTLMVGIGVHSLWSVQSALRTVADDRLPKVVAAKDMAIQVQTMAVMVRNLVLLSDDAARKVEKERLDKQRQALARLDEQLTASVRSEQGLAGLATVKTTMAAFTQSLDKVLAQAAKPEEAVQSLLTDLRPRQDAALSAIEALASLQIQQAGSAKADAEAAGQTGLVLWLALGGSLILALAAGGWTLVRQLAVQLGGEPAEAAAIASRIADSDLTQAIAVQPGDSTSVIARMAAMQVSLSAMVAEVRRNSDSVATASAQIAQGNQDLSGRTEQQASALQETAATMEQLGTTVRHNADNARQANQLAQSASSIAEAGGSVVGQVVQTMKGINDSSRKIADIIGVIDGIAFQTNILALNAAVEAARAGEQGRGFAVVASEVRSLAQRSADAAREIKSLITASVEQVEHGSSLVDQAGKTMDEIVASIRRVSDIVAEISTASAEQSSGVQQVGQTVTQMDQATQQNAALVEQSAAAAQSLTNQAQLLVATVAPFRLA